MSNSLNTTFQVPRLGLQLSRFNFGFQESFQSTFKNVCKIQARRRASSSLTLPSGLSSPTAKNKKSSKFPPLLVLLHCPFLLPFPTSARQTSSSSTGQTPIAFADVEELNPTALRRSFTISLWRTFGHPLDQPRLNSQLNSQLSPQLSPQISTSTNV